MSACEYRVDAFAAAFVQHEWGARGWRRELWKKNYVGNEQVRADGDSKDQERRSEHVLLADSDATG